jgi:branched-chain amino acid transport system ATP-binding protein
MKQPSPAVRVGPPGGEIATPPRLAVRGVSIAFAGVRALHDVSFEVGAGITALIGPNGAGKTTLLNCISGLYRHEGRIELAGRDLGRAPAQVRARRGVARTFQTPTLLDDLDVLDNVLLGAHSHLPTADWGRGRAVARDVRHRALELLDRFGLLTAVQERAGDLAHADRRRVETARALIATPSVLLFDEPAAGLDDDEALALVRLSAEAVDSVVLVEHNMHLVMSVASHVVVLASGALLAQGTADDVRRDPQVIEAYLGDGVV